MFLNINIRDFHYYKIGLAVSAIWGYFAPKRINKCKQSNNHFIKSMLALLRK